MLQKVAEGPMDFTVKLSMQGETAKEIRQSAEGQISLRSKQLTVNGTDLDEMFDRFESSQHFNLVDVAAFFYAGPVGLVITKGYNFANLLQASAGHSRIQELISDWKVEHGVAQAMDVAMATNKNRIALQGKLDFVNEQFDDVTVALIDAEGCVKVKQTIGGSFQEPEVGKPSILKSLAGPVLKLLEKGRDLLPGDECDVFYAGLVAAPK
jgi:AsmA protein